MSGLSPWPRGTPISMTTLTLWSGPNGPIRFGPTSLYRLPGRTLVNTRLPYYMDAQGAVTPYPAFNAYNYPPLAGYLMWLQGWAWSATDRRGGFGVQRRFCRPRRTRLVGHLGGRISTSAGGS